MKSSQLPHCCWLKFALLFVTRRARKDWCAKHRLECTRQGFASSHVWNDHNWLKFARTQAVSLCAKSNQTNIDQQRTALTREGGPVNPELLFLIDYVLPSMICIYISVSDRKQEDPEFLRFIAQEVREDGRGRCFSIFPIENCLLRNFCFSSYIQQATYTFLDLDLQFTPTPPTHPFWGLHKSVRMEWWPWWSWGILRVGFKGESSSAGERSRIRLADNLRPGVSLWPTSQPYSTV